jgi:pimeloyl-ACP methyl ester carboxylesterase
MFPDLRHQSRLQVPGGGNNISQEIELSSAIQISKNNHKPKLATKQKTTGGRILDALPDSIDFRDINYIPTLVRVPPVSDLEEYIKHDIPVLDQGTEGACTGFGLATVANYLIRVRGEQPEADEVSAWMLYSMAKRYDEWPGEDYDGSSARGAMKGWHKHGLCAYRLWRDNKSDTTLNAKRAADAIERPLGAYFRVNHKNLVAMHAAINEVGILYATASVHTGWQKIRSGDEEIAYEEDLTGGHAFAIVGYDREGFWIQNSWGADWGVRGLVRLTYADWLANGSDVWVAALGAPVHLGSPWASALMRAGAPRTLDSNLYASLRPHIITARNDGVLDDKGDFGLTEKGLKNILLERLPAAMDERGWKKKRVALYAHGGLVPMDAAIQTVANNREALLESEVWPISIVWRSDVWTTLGNIIRDAFARRRDEGFLDKTKDFMIERLDDTLEPLARVLGGKMLWDEMKENARLASAAAKGAAKLAADHLITLAQKGIIDEIHLVGHSAGANLLAPLAQHLARKVPIKSLSLWAPACTIDCFEEFYLPLINDKKIEAFDLYTLDDETERADDCADIYHKSLLYLVSAAFEETPRIPWLRPIGTQLLGLARDIKEARLTTKWYKQRCNWYVAPAMSQTRARRHGDFDNDEATLTNTLSRILGSQPVKSAAPIALEPILVKDPTCKRRIRQELDAAFARR